MLAALAVGLVVLVGAVSHLSADDGAEAASRSQECVARATAPTEEIGQQAATWVRFCPLAEEGAPMRARHPGGVVTGDLAVAAAETLWQTQEGRRVCEVDTGSTPGPARRFRIEVGIADGRIAELRGDTGCSTRDIAIFSQLETTLLMDAAGRARSDVPLTPVRCPRRLTTRTTNADGESADQLVDDTEHPWQSTVPLLPMPAVAIDVCAYSGAGERRELVDQWRSGPPTSDAVRAQATLGYRDGMTDCEPQPDATSYVVVMQDFTGTARTFTLDAAACGAMSAAIGTPPVDTYLGLASPALVRLVRDSKSP